MDGFSIVKEEVINEIKDLDSLTERQKFLITLANQGKHVGEELGLIREEIETKTAMILEDQQQWRMPPIMDPNQFLLNN